MLFILNRSEDWYSFGSMMDFAGRFGNLIESVNYLFMVFEYWFFYELRV